MTSTTAAPARPAQSGTSGRTAVLVLVAAVLVAMLALPVRSWFLQRASIAEAQQQLAASQASISELSQEQRDWQDKAHIEEQARLRLNYVYPGEVGIVVIGPDEPAVAAQEEPRTWYDSLWQTVESASGRGQTALGDPIQVRDSAPR